MALDSHDEAVVRGLEGLDEVACRALGPGRRAEARREIGRAHGLVVIRVHDDRRVIAAAGMGARRRRLEIRARPGARDRARRGGGIRERSAEQRGPVDPDRMRRGRPVSPARARVSVDMLEERAAREDVDRLEPPADPEDGDARARVPPPTPPPRARPGRPRRCASQRPAVRRGWGGCQPRPRGAARPSTRRLRRGRRPRRSRRGGSDGLRGAGCPPRRGRSSARRPPARPARTRP